MRVAIVVNTSWNIYNFRMNFVKALQKAGHEVHAIAPRDEYSRHLEEAGCKYHNLHMDSRGANPVKDSALILELAYIYWRIKPDVVLHFTVKPNVYGTLAAALLGIPSVNNVCGLGTVFLKKGLVSKVAKLLYKISFRFPKKVFFQNPDDLRLFVEEKLVKQEIAAILPGSGIDLDVFTPTPLTRNMTFRFLMISRLIVDKGVYEFVDAIRKIKEKGIHAHFFVLGAIDEEHKRGIPAAVVEGWVHEGLFEYLGTTDDVRPYIQQSDCVVLPSYREGSPRSLMEAACMGRPVVATDVPGCHQVVRDGFNGLLCESHNASDLADKMIEMMSLPERVLQRMGTYGRRKMELEFSDKTVALHYLSAINELAGLDRNPNGTPNAVLGRTGVPALPRAHNHAA